MNWHCFLDRSYFDTWAVQHKDRRSFYEAIHVNTREEAEFLVEQLNRVVELEEALRKVKSYMGAHYTHECWTCLEGDPCELKAAWEALSAGEVPK